MTDRELTQQFIKGNHRTFAEIVHRYSGMVFSKALGVMHTEEGAAEVTQQTFVRAYESIDAWRGTELAPWLAAIAVHTALKLLDKERRRRTSSLDALSNNVSSKFATESSYSEEPEHHIFYWSIIAAGMGIGLLVSFVIEYKLRKKERQEKDLVESQVDESHVG